MKISEIRMKKFKRFTDLSITGIPETAKLVILAGPNGCGKSSLFDGFNTWHRESFGIRNDEYFNKGPSINIRDPRSARVSVNIMFHDYGPRSDRSLAMYFRSAYRHEPEFKVENFNNSALTINPHRVSRLVDRDTSVSANYQWLLMSFINGVTKEDISTKELRERILGGVNESLISILDNELIINGIDISDLPTGSGATFTFRKGETASSPYINLSAGEKAVFDLILDLRLKIDNYSDTVFVIDEPELHVHTDAQGKLIHEICKIIPDNSQLWVATHSLGIMQAAVEMDSKKPGSVACLDFSGHNFDTIVEMTPSRITRKLIDKFTSIALGNVEFFSLISAKFIVVCEGHGRLKDDNSSPKKSIDSDVYSSIFGKEYDDMEFIAAEGGREEVKRTVRVFRALMEGKNTHIAGVVDRDDSSLREGIEAMSKYIFHLPGNRRNIESYLLDDEIVRNLGKQCNKNEEIIQSCLEEIKDVVSKNPIKGKSEHDNKPALREIYSIIKNKFDPMIPGSTTSAFLTDTMAPLITPETEVYKEMEKLIITPIRESNKNIAKSE